MSNIHAYLVSSVARAYGVDKRSRTFTPWSHVVADVVRDGQVVQIWTALLCYLILRFIAFMSKWKGAFSRLFTIIKGGL